MSRKSRRAARALGKAPAPSAIVPIQYGGSGFDGANFSTRRGYIYFPTLETRKEVDAYTRLELIRRARWLKRNTGYARRCINGIAQMVGALLPRPQTRDKEWNALAERAWSMRAQNAQTFDLSKRFSVDSYQTLITRSRLLDGDFLSVFTLGPDGGARVGSYEGHQVGNGNHDSLEWRDGVTRDASGAPLAYAVVTDYETGQTVDIPASACVLNADYDSFGWGRAPSALAHAVNNLLDTTEICSDVKLGIKTSGRVAYYEYAPKGEAPLAPGLRDPVASNLVRRGTPATGNYQSGDVGGTPFTPGNFLAENLFSGGRIPYYGNGHEIKQLLDERPHPNSLGFLDHINRDIAAGLDMASDVLWNIGKLGGASVRYVLADAQTTVNRHQQLLVDQFLSRFWVYFVACEVAARRLRPCADPDWMFSVGWLPPAKLTVDVSRDGKLSIDLHRAGLLTAKRWYGMQGLDGEAEDRERVEEYARRLALCAEVEAEYKARGIKIVIDPEKVFPTGVPGAPQARPDGPPGSPQDPEEPEPALSSEEAFLRVESSIEELRERLFAA